MPKKLFYLITMLFCASAASFAQAKISPPPTPEPEDVIRVSSKLVLVDALVLDKNGKQVTDLSSEDFEILQDGKPQRITTFSYVNGENNFAAPLGKKNALPLPPVAVRSQKGRIITFVIDDGNCLSTPEGLEIARDGVRKFINEQMLPDDKVAIYRTRGGSSLQQIYTSNKEVLKRVVNKVNWFPSGCGSAFDATKNDVVLNIPQSRRENSTTSGQGKTTFDSDSDKQFKSNVADTERTIQAKGSFGVLSVVIDRLRAVPQRKLVFFVSEGIPISSQSRQNAEIFDALRGIADKASRASVVFYTISEKGLTIPGMVEAKDEISSDEIVEARIEEERTLNSGLAYLAYQTGGKFIRNKNFIDTEIRKILQTENGYYLIGYDPTEDTFDGKNFHKIEVKLKRDDLKISARKGFYGREEKEQQAKYKNADSPLYQAISSPFQENTIDMRLTTLVGSDAKTGNYLRVLFHINGQDLTFADDANDAKKVVLDVVAVALDEKGKVIEEFNRTYPIRIPAAGVEIVRQNGLDYSSDIPFKKPGFYSFRIAVRDENSKRLASAGDYIEIPDPKKDKFFSDGLLTTDITKDGKPLLPKARSVETAFAPVFMMTIPSIRQYRAGAPFAYIYNIHQAELDKANNQPKLTAHFRLFKNGALIAEGQEKPVEVGNQADLRNIQSYGFLKLNENAEIGEYILQIIVKDKIADKTSTQWIDFEVFK